MKVWLNRTVEFYIVCVYIYLLMSGYIYIHTRTYLSIYLSLYIYIHTYTHTYVYTFNTHIFGVAPAQ